MSSILFDVKDNIAIITLNRPDKYNAFNREMALELQGKLDECKIEKNIRAVYITGKGKAFCSGQDLDEVVDPNGPDVSSILSQHYNPIIKIIRKLEKPVVAAVNGVSAGAGANIALCCDVVVASQSSSFIQAFSKIGLIPDSGGTFFLPRLIGWQKASALFLLGEKISAAEAESMGMIYKVFPDETFAEESLKIAFTLAQMPTKALGYTKRALQASFHNSLHNQLIEEDELQQQAAGSPEFVQRVNAFIKK